MQKCKIYNGYINKDNLNSNNSYYTNFINNKQNNKQNNRKKTYNNSDIISTNIQCPKDIKNPDNIDCGWDKNNNGGECVCKHYQQNYATTISEKCCQDIKRVCSNYKSQEECIPKKNRVGGDKGKYYCIEKNKELNKVDVCNTYSINKIKTIENTCGYNSFKLSDNIVYKTDENCKLNIDMCSKYNSKTKCTGDGNCGWCVDNSDNQICVSGTSVGPLDLKYRCMPNSKEFKNSYTHGQTNPFISPNYKPVYSNTL